MVFTGLRVFIITTALGKGLRRRENHKKRDTVVVMPERAYTHCQSKLSWFYSDGRKACLLSFCLFFLSDDSANGEERQLEVHHKSRLHSRDPTATTVFRLQPRAGALRKCPWPPLRICQPHQILTFRNIARNPRARPPLCAPCI